LLSQKSNGLLFRPYKSAIASKHADSRARDTLEIKQSVADITAMVADIIGGLVELLCETVGRFILRLYGNRKPSVLASGLMGGVVWIALMLAFIGFVHAVAPRP
jgi:hypothetical protein